MRTASNNSLFFFSFYLFTSTYCDFQCRTYYFNSILTNSIQTEMFVCERAFRFYFSFSSSVCTYVGICICIEVTPFRKWQFMCVFILLVWFRLSNSLVLSQRSVAQMPFEVTVWRCLVAWLATKRKITARKVMEMKKMKLYVYTSLHRHGLSWIGKAFISHARHRLRIRFSSICKFVCSM